MSHYSALASRIRVSFQDVEKSVQRALDLSKKARISGDDGYWDAVALNLHSFYTGVEHILEDIARTLEDDLPQGSGWHSDLLTRMSGEIEGVRPAVISQKTRIGLDEFLGFRHVVRNVYAFNLRAGRLNELITDLPDCLDSVRSDLIAFAEFLESI